MTDDLELLIAAMARHQAHHHQCSLATATRQIRGLSAEAREEYRAVGAPYGDDDQGFCRLPPCAPAPHACCVVWCARRSHTRWAGEGYAAF
jgi:hypothetical protein